MAFPGNYGNFTAVITSGVTTSQALDLGAGGYTQVYINIPAANVGATRLYGSPSFDGTYVPICGSAATAVTWISTVSNVLVRVPEFTRFVQVIASTAPATSVSYAIICV